MFYLNRIRVFLFRKLYILIVFWCVSFLALYAFVSKPYRLQNNVDVFSTPLEGKVVIVDPGHGGIDAGASSGDVLEKELNLEIARILQEYLEESGAVAILTRTDDTNTADPNRKKGTTQKMSDLRERKDDIEEFSADMFISIHMNKFSESNYRGAQVFYPKGTEESKLLGENIQQSIKETLNDGNTRLAKATNDIFVLKDNKIPSSLIECGFLSNQEETKLLTDKNYQRKMAWGIYLGIVRYFSR